MKWAVKQRYFDDGAETVRVIKMAEGSEVNRFERTTEYDEYFFIVDTLEHARSFLRYARRSRRCA